MNTDTIHAHLKIALLPVMIAGASLLSTVTSDAAITLDITDFQGSNAPISILAGQSFDITVKLNSTNESIIGLSYYLQAIGSGSGKFSISSRSTGGTLYSDLQTVGSVTGLLSAINSVDLGGSTSDLSANGPGSYLLAKYTITTDSTLKPGIYTLKTSDDSQALDSEFALVDIPSAPLTVTVVPEPGSIALALSGTALLALRRRR